MQRWFRLGTVLTALFLAMNVGLAQIVNVTGRVAQNEVRVFLQGNVYQISGTFTVAGTLIIEPGTEVVFLDNGRIIDSVGGRIIADGRLRATYNNTAPQSVGLLRYNDMRYFLNGSVVSEQSFNEPTVQGTLAYPGNFTNPGNYGKFNHVFNVVLDTTNKRLVNLTTPTALPGSGSGMVVVTPMRAIMFESARLSSDDDIIKFQPWKRLGNRSVSIPFSNSNTRIVFRAQRVNDYSREWGHIIVLPGARAAFFRDCDFRDFRKDTTVDDKPIYRVNNMDTVGRTPAQKTAMYQAFQNLNAEMNALTNGSGGALTSFASRTWLVNCNFTNNLARYRGGALQLLQAPDGRSVYSDTTGLGIGYYPWVDKNPGMTEANGSPIAQRVRQLDGLDGSGAEPAVSVSDARRQLADDARLAVYAGRIRQLTFQNNSVVNSDVDTVRVNNNRVVDDVDRPSKLYDRAWKNEAFGGALYISGRKLDENRKIEISLGMNDSLRIGTNQLGQGVYLSMGSKDFIRFENNTALTRQPLLAVVNGQVRNNRGAKGGALYIGTYTSVVLNGSFRNNKTQTPYLTNDNTEILSLGGAVFHDNTLGRLQIRGSQSSTCEFIGNTAGTGGAIHVNGNTDPRPSPVIGGSDVLNPRIRDYGRRILFADNKAVAHGGAVYTNRNMTSYGAGGFINDLPLAQAYGPGFSVRFENNTAGYSGGALAIHLPSIEPPVPMSQRYVRLVRSEFVNNRVGEMPANTGLEMLKNIRGGGAVYTMNGDLNVVKGVLFEDNKAFNGNGGAVAMVHPRTASRRFFISDADMVQIDNEGVAMRYNSTDSLFDNRRITAVPADVRMLTRFINNMAETNPNEGLLGSGTTQMARNIIDIKRFHPGFMRDLLGNGIRENGIGLGGAIYVLDSVTPLRNFRSDSIHFNRVRIQGNSAYTGSAIYSDNYDLKLVLTKCLVTGNKATSPIGRTQDVVRGPKIGNDNPASSDLAGAVFYGDVYGPIPWNTYHIGANAIYDNDARFLIRLPDAPNTKGTLAGGYGTGLGHIVMLRGNYWGRTEANVNTLIQTSIPGAGSVQETFFVQGNGKTHMRFVRNAAQRTDDTQQGPFEQNSTFTYTYTPIAIGKIPDTLLMAGRIYDIFDKGTDVKTVDYSNRRMAPIEDFAVGIPPNLRYFRGSATPSNGKYVRRWTRNPFDTDSMNYQTGMVNNLWKELGRLQTEWRVDHRTNEFAHPIGYPLFLEAQAAYEGENPYTSNEDPTILNESVFFVVNDSTGDFIRVNMKQITDVGVQNNLGQYPREFFRGKVDFVLDDPTRNGVTARQRRTYEGLMNFGGSQTLLSRIADSARNEDISALSGRRWELTMSPSLSKKGVQYNNGSKIVYSNRPGMPATLASGIDTLVSYYAGERWNSLPVRPGDFVRVISRTVLWRKGIDTAMEKGMGFRISASTPPPVFTGNKVQTQNPNVSPLYKSSFANKLWVYEDEVYNRDVPNTLRGRDSIFVLSAIDSNRMYDPRWALGFGSGDTVYYNQLQYEWYPLYITPNGDTINDVSANKLTGLRRWVKADTVWPTDPRNSYYEAMGYVELKGQPSNPYVIPGGEWMEVKARNYPPTIRTVDALKNVKYRTRGGNNDSLFIADTLSKFIYLYSPYFHAPVYDKNDLDPSVASNARYLQQDTLNYGLDDETKYRFMIFVTDSLPVWDNITRTSAECAQAGASQQLLVANVTDKLRFYADFNTDDEREDSVAANNENWDFRFGRTSYGFASKSIRSVPGDTAVDEIYQLRPIWMSDRLMFDEESDISSDPFASAFTTRGVLNVRIPRANALQLLKPESLADNAHGALNLDTLITVVVNDGHGGVNYLTTRVFVNVSPTITTTSLPRAKEDQDYNLNLLDFDRRIMVNDPNFGQRHTFRLLYNNSQDSLIAKDPCFEEAGSFDVSKMKTTPNWLRINPVSGLLYGTPRVTDAPRKIEFGNPDTVTVVVTDAGGLTDVRQIILEVDSVNHAPKIRTLPLVRCISNGETYVDSLISIDRDLLRNMPVQGRETVTISVVEPSGVFEVNPSTFTGPLKDTNNFEIRASGGKVNIPAASVVDGKVRVVLQITDGEETRTVEYYLNVSDPVNFSVPIRVANNTAIGAFQVLNFGTAVNATTGEKQGEEGRLDSNYCEYELPPLPFSDTFDARWTVAKTNGILRNMFPTAVQNVAGAAIYKARFQAGNLTGNFSAAYPVTISWNRDSVPDRTDTRKNPSGASWFIRDGNTVGTYFDYNMKLGVGKKAAGDAIRYESTGNISTIVVNQDVVDGFVIYYDFVSGAEETVPGLATALTINDVTPNPVSNHAIVRFALPTSSYVTSELYDALGNKVLDIFSGYYDSGMHPVEFEAPASLASGMYTVKLTANGNTVSHQVAVIK